MFLQGRAAWEALVAGTDLVDPAAKEADAASKFYSFAEPSGSLGLRQRKRAVVMHP